MANRTALPALPDWMTWEVEEVLGKVRPPHVARKLRTVIELAQAQALDQPLAPVFGRPETCSSTTWYGRYAGGEKRPGWREDPQIAEALRVCTERARRWENTRMARALAEAAERLAMASPAAVAVAIRAMGASDDNVKLRAAFGILDRAGVETAPKQQQEHGVSPELERLIEQVYGADHG